MNERQCGRSVQTVKPLLVLEMNLAFILSKMRSYWKVLSKRSSLIFSRFILVAGLRRDYRGTRAEAERPLEAVAIITLRDVESLVQNGRAGGGGR